MLQETVFVATMFLTRIVLPIGLTILAGRWLERALTRESTGTER